MEDKKLKIYIWENLHWDIKFDSNGEPTYITARCPKQKCNCKLVKSKEEYSRGEYKYYCPKCDFKITLNKSVEDKASELAPIIESEKFKDAEIINIDGELIKVLSEYHDETDYWVEVKISKNKKEEVQLMILAGNRLLKNKTQLFLEPKNEKLTFDQNNDHPSKIFTKVTAQFKRSKSIISST